MARFANLILDRPGSVLATLVAVSLVLGAAATRVQIDDSVEGMLLTDDPERAYYASFLERFGSDELVVIGVGSAAPYRRPFLEFLDDLSRGLLSIRLDADGVSQASPAIDRVWSLSTAVHVGNRRDEPGGAAVVIEPLMRALPSSSEQESLLWEKASRDPLYLGNILATPASGDPAAPVMTLVIGRIVHREGDLQYRRAVHGKVRQLLRREIEAIRGTGELEIDGPYLAGTVILKASLGETAQVDLARVLPISTFVIFGVLLALFRSIRVVALSLATVSLAVVWTLGLLTLCGSYLTVVSSVILELIQIIGITTAIHIFSQYFRVAGDVREAREIVVRTLTRVGWPCFLASLTTAIGLASLGVSTLVPVREVGIYSAFGVLSTWIIAVTLIPVVLAWLPPPARSEYAMQHRGAVPAILDFLAALGNRLRWPVLLVATAVVVIAGAGISRIRAETDLLGFLDRDHPLRRSYAAIRHELGGIDPLDITVATAPGGLLDPSILEKIDRLQAWLESQPEIDQTLSAAPWVKRVNQELHGGAARFHRVPETRARVANALFLLENSRELVPFLFPDWEQASEARVAARVNSIRSADLAALIARCREYLAAHVVSHPSLLYDPTPLQASGTGFAVLDTLSRDLQRLVGLRSEPGSGWLERRESLQQGEVAARVTGISLLYAQTVESLVDGQISSLALAFVVIWLTVIILLRSPWAGTIAMIPNLLPIVAVLGFMGYAGVTLNLGTAMIGSICMGIAVDDTIHFLVRYRTRLAEGERLEQAIRGTLHDVGRPIVTTSIALVLGFTAFFFSGFLPHVHFGILSSVTIAMALLGDLVLLPACLVVLKPRIPPTRGDVLGRPTPPRRGS